MKKAPSSPLAIVTMAVVAVAWASSTGLRAAEATIESTCAAAAARDRRVDTLFCAQQFLTYHGAAEADLWGLARTAALIGVSLGDDAVFDVHEGTIHDPPAGGAMGKAAMGECAQAYDAVGMAFAEAADELGAWLFERAQERFDRVAPLVRRCDAALAVAGARTPPVLARYGANCQQMAVIGAAITNLIK
ncbi:pectinesterase inhibitor 8-like [Miscanthus floridulus]|uniref:pectinesterase inhibitor 8-like n=1 Tax=Miscanthus floridulus TaxID=154761 RepID=UPI00345A44FC